MTEFAGSLRERVEILTRTPARDALAAPGEDWTLTDQVWARCVPIGQAQGAAPARPTGWRITMRPCAVAVGDRVDRVGGMIDVRAVVTDPATPDRIVVLGEGVQS